MNQAFVNSDILIRLTLICTERYNGPEKSNMNEMFNDFAVYKVCLLVFDHL